MERTCAAQIATLTMMRNACGTGAARWWRCTRPWLIVVRYGYDALGNLNRKTDEDGLDTLYAYLKQLTQMRDWLGTTKVEMDSQSRVAQVTDFEGKKVSCGWDGSSHRKKLVYPDGSEVRYGYDALGCLAGVGTTEGETRYGYDPLGRMRERERPMASGRSMAWTHWGGWKV